MPQLRREDGRSDLMMKTPEESKWISVKDRLPEPPKEDERSV